MRLMSIRSHGTSEVCFIEDNIYIWRQYLIYFTASLQSCCSTIRRGNDICRHCEHSQLLRCSNCLDTFWNYLWNKRVSVLVKQTQYKVNLRFGDLLVPLNIESPEIYKNDCLVSFVLHFKTKQIIMKIMRLASLLTGLLHSGLPCLLLIILTFILVKYLRKVNSLKVELSE